MGNEVDMGFGASLCIAKKVCWTGCTGMACWKTIAAWPVAGQKHDHEKIHEVRCTTAALKHEVPTVMLALAMPYLIGNTHIDTKYKTRRAI